MASGGAGTTGGGGVLLTGGSAGFGDWGVGDGAGGGTGDSLLSTDGWV